MFLAMLLYLLLCLPVYLRIDACVYDTGAALHVSLGSGIVRMRYDARLYFEEGRIAVKQSSTRRRKDKNAFSFKRLGVLRRTVRSIIRASYIRKRRAYVRVGMGDAAQTASAVGVLQALLSMMMTRDPDMVWHVVPDYRRRDFLASYSCIFAAAPGDTVAVLLRWMIAARRAGKETRNRERDFDGTASD